VLRLSRVDCAGAGEPLQRWFRGGAEVQQRWCRAGAGQLSRCCGSTNVVVQEQGA